MPLYEYHCSQCDHTFEVNHAVGRNGQKCPLCNRKATKVFHAPSLIFKGSGWHVTDYCRDKGQAQAESVAAKVCEKQADGACPGCPPEK